MSTDDRRQLTHLDESGAARMVDVGDKAITKREATAECWVEMQPETARAIRDAAVAKGDALGVARVAAIMGAKRTPELIPLCRPLPMTGIAAALQGQERGGRREP